MKYILATLVLYLMILPAGTSADSVKMKMEFDYVLNDPELELTKVASEVYWFRPWIDFETNSLICEVHLRAHEADLSIDGIGFDAEFFPLRSYYEGRLKLFDDIEFDLRRKNCKEEAVPSEPLSFQSCDILAICRIFQL